MEPEKENLGDTALDPNSMPGKPGELAQMFTDGYKTIGTHKVENLFEHMEANDLSEEQQSVIQQRIQLQRRMLQEYEKRERKRKVAEITDVCPDITEEEAGKALDMCHNREEEATAQLTAGEGFKERVRAALQMDHDSQHAGAVHTVGRSKSTKQHWSAKPGASRPRAVKASSLGDGVFVGSFRGRGPFGKAPARPHAAKQIAAGTAEADDAAAEAAEPADSMDTESEGEPDEAMEQSSPIGPDLLGASTPAPAATTGDLVDGKVAAAAIGEGHLASGLTPEQQMHVLTRRLSNGTLRPVTTSELKTVRRANGLESTDNSPQAAPTSGLKNRPGSEPAIAAAPQVQQAAASNSDKVSKPMHQSAARAQQAFAAADAAAGQDVSDPAEDTQAMEEPESPMVDETRTGQQPAPSSIRTGNNKRIASQRASRATMNAKWASDEDADGDCSSDDVSLSDASDDVMISSDDEEFEGIRRTRQAPSKVGTRKSTRTRAPSAAYRDLHQTTEDAIDGEDADGDAGQAGKMVDEEACRAAAPEALAEPEQIQKAATANKGKRSVRKPRTLSTAASEADAGTDDVADLPSQNSSLDDIILAARARRASGSQAISKPVPQLAKPQSAKAAPNTKAFGLKNKKPIASDRVTAITDAGPDAQQSADLPQATPHADVNSSAPENGVPAIEIRKSPGDQAKGSAQSAGKAPKATNVTNRGASEEASPAADARQAVSKAANSKAGGRDSRAISRTGHTNRGRVRQKSHKSAELVDAGIMRHAKDWYNSGYIFPEGFESRVHFRSSVALDQLCVHNCSVIGKGGKFWPGPTFRVRAMDRETEPLIAKSCTGCWTAVLKRINAEIEARRKAGENLPPPPKTAIAGPEYFGFNQPEIVEAVEALDPERFCELYWQGKGEREAAAAGLPPAESSGGPPRAPRAPSGGARKRGKRNREGSDEENAVVGSGNEEDEHGQQGVNRWSAVSRTERYRKRCGDEGDAEDVDNPLPGYMDPITFQPVNNPAISPWGHVMGLATWKAVLAEHGMCPFTKNRLSWEQCTVLSHSNIERFRSRIKSCSA